MLFARVYFPFALGYAISYFYRNTNAIIESDLVNELGLGPADLGLLTGAYFFSFAIFQLPLGILLDRYGPRRTEAVLLLFAALGAWIFSNADSLSGLILGRLLIGLGVSACLMAAFKAYVIWFSRGRLPMINGLQMAAGGLGALVATTPLQNVLSITDWRGVFTGLAIITVFASLFLWFILPEHQSSADKHPAIKTQLKEMGQIFRNPVFWSIVPLTALSNGSFLAIHGLWIKPWLRDVASLGEGDTTQLLFAMTLAIIVGYFSLGIFTERISQLFDIGPITVGVFGMTLFLTTQFSMAYGWATSPLLLVVIFGFLGSSCILTFAGLAQIFPKKYSGRVSTILNVQVFMGAFIIQWGIGAIIELWPTTEIGYDPASYQVAIGVLVLMQAAGLVWYLLSQQLIKKQPEKI
ncbi:MAG: MFS transporter [Candidatus Lambdaproteobacteria bacterium]|jgi:predicted MFS family arabinose efflux permease